MFLDVSARSAELEVVVETIDHDHVERVIAALAEVGLAARVGSVAFGPPLSLTGRLDSSSGRGRRSIVAASTPSPVT